MKIDICRRSYDTVCDNPKFCCDRLKVMTEARIFHVGADGVMITNYSNSYNLDIAPMSLIPIKYCPFCGEKIE